MFQEIYFQIFNYIMSAARELQLRVRLPNGEDRCYGDATSACITITISDKAFFKRVIQDGGIGLGESYTDGFWQTEQLTDFLRFLIANKKYFDRKSKYFKGIGHFLNALTHRLRSNTVENQKFPTLTWLGRG